MDKFKFTVKFDNGCLSIKLTPKLDLWTIHEPYTVSSIMLELEKKLLYNCIGDKFHTYLIEEAENYCKSYIDKLIHEGFVYVPETINDYNVAIDKIFKDLSINKIDYDLDKDYLSIEFKFGVQDFVHGMNAFQFHYEQRNIKIIDWIVISLIRNLTSDMINAKLIDNKGIDLFKSKESNRLKEFERKIRLDMIMYYNSESLNEIVFQALRSNIDNNYLKNAINNLIDEIYVSNVMES